MSSGLMRGHTLNKQVVADSNEWKTRRMMVLRQKIIEKKASRTEISELRGMIGFGQVQRLLLMKLRRRSR